MKKNMGAADRAIRTLLAILFGILLFTNQVAGTLAIILAIVAIAFLLTSALGWCPVYVPFGISTRKTEKK
ncbi:MAG: DUF2892 domain-containing protein [bacterium]